MIGTNLGRLEKLRIEAFMDQEFREKKNEFVITFNPETFSKSYEVMSSPRKGRGKSGHKLDFAGMKPQALSFEFMIDGSGALGEKVAVDKEISRFIETVYKYEGEVHQPKWLKLSWGTELFKCVVQKVDINYAMFRPDGSPLRATIKATFLENISDKFRAARDKTSSPDLTHQRVIGEGENLVSMTYRIYESIQPLILVARTNDLDSLRGLEPGMKLLFPPIE